MSHSFSYENEKSGAAKASDVLVQLDGQPDNLASVYCSQCQLCNKNKVESETKVINSVLVNGESISKVNNVENSDKTVVVVDSNTNSESRKTTITSRVVMDCDAILSLPPHSDDIKMMTSSSNGTKVCGGGGQQRSKKKKARGRQLLYSNGASSDLKDSSSQAGDKGSNDDEVNLWRESHIFQ